MKTSSKKQKGRMLQKWVCEYISKLLNIPWGPEDEKLIQSRPMGQSGVDVVLRGKALKRFPFSIECKNQERWNINEYIKGAVKNQKKGTNWLLFLCRNNLKSRLGLNKKNPLVIMESELFFEIYRGYLKQK